MYVKSSNSSFVVARAQFDRMLFLTSQRIEWKFNPSLHHILVVYGSSISKVSRSFNFHLKWQHASTATLLAISCDGDELEALTPGHFLIGHPLEALPDPTFSCHAVSLLKR